jgi:uncharacterized cupredoxin-like copper-binding protein
MVKSRGLVAILLGLVLLAGTGCAGTSSPSGAQVDVGERDFKLTASVDHVPAGWVTFQIHNVGPSTHEFNLDRTTLASDSLPLQPSSLQVSEESPQLHRIVSISQIRLGSTHDLRVRLVPGQYVIYCNLEGHYLGGMHVALAVTA